jgi:hypothetical protein
MYVTGRDAPYNLHRVSRRHDPVATQIYFGQALRRTMELAFALERRYAPYPKWQYRLLRTLGGCAPKVLPLLDQLVDDGGEGGNASDSKSQISDLKSQISDLKSIHWRARVDALIQINHIYSHRLHELGLTGPPAIQPFHEGLTDLTLYSSAKEVYAQLPAAWREISFNQIESWEKLARLVLFDAGDYVHKKFEAADER